jgi:hypothetical protein
VSRQGRLPKEVYELALHYLLELSTDIRGAAFVDAGGALLAIVPDTPGGQARELVTELAREAAEIAGEDDGGTAELDVLTEAGAVFVVVEHELSMVCVTARAVLAGLIFHDMHAVLADLARAANEGERRTASTGSSAGGAA